MMGELYDQDTDPDQHHDQTRGEMLAEILERQGAIMANLTALTDAVDSLTATVTAVEAEVGSLTAAATADQPAIDAATAAIETALTALEKLIPAPVAVASVYTFSGDPAVTPIDTTQWIPAKEETTDVPPLSLYTYALDVVNGDKLGDGVGGVWHLYTGPVQPVAGP